MARFAPGATTIRPFLHKLRGVKIHGKVFIGDDVYLENAHPDCIEIHDGAQIILRTNIICLCRGTGKIVIGKNVWIGMSCNIATTPGQTLNIGEGAVVGMGSTVTRDIAPFTFAMGSPAKPKFKITVPMTSETSYEDWKRGLVPIKRE
jgi:acetyltransferase-like isoleucine patch superfamily enzyme